MSANIFTVKRSEIEGRLDPIYYIRKNELVGYKHLKLEKIGKYFFVKDGDHDKLPDDAVSDENNGFRYLRAQDLKENKIISEKPIYVTKKYFESVRRCHIYPNDLLFSIMASVGATAVVPKNFSICTANRAVGILRAKNESVFLPEYVQVVLNTELGIKLLELQKRGGIQQRVNLDDISNLELPVFDFEKQRKIIDFYNSALSQKEQKQKQAKELLASIDSYLLSELGITLPQKDNSLSKRIFTTKFSEVSGGRLDPKFYSTESKAIKNAVENSKYDTKTLKEFIVQSVAGDWGYEEGENIPNTTKCLVIRSTEFDNDYNLKLDNTRAKYRVISNLKLEKIDLKENDLFIEKSGGSEDQPVGRIAILTKDILESDNLCYSNFIHKISVENIDPEYLFCYLKTFHSIKLTDTMFAQTNGLQNLLMTTYFNQKIPLPPLPKQKEIAEHIRSTRAQAKQLQTEAEQIMQDAKHQVEKMILGE